MHGLKCRHKWIGIRPIHFFYKDIDEINKKELAKEWKLCYIYLADEKHMGVVG